LLAGLSFVRRLSGGTALVHDREVTYSLALPAGEPWQRRGESWVARLHEILRSALAVLGVRADLCPPNGERGRGEFLCFLHHTPDDLLIGPAKVAGSAQRRPHGALLQHGGVLLARSPHTPALPGIAELTGRRIAAADLEAAVCDAFVRWTGAGLIRGNWTDAERRRVAVLAAERYRNPAWNDKR
jgi:lipoate-protein ligase A